MLKVKFKVIHHSARVLGRKSYFQVIDPRIVIDGQTIIVKGHNGEIVAILHNQDSLIFVSVKSVE